MRDDFDRPDSGTTMGGPWDVESGTWGIDAGRGYLASAAGGTPRPSESSGGGNFACISVETGQSAADITVTNHRNTFDGYGAIFFAMDSDPATGQYLRLEFDGSAAFDLGLHADVGYGIDTYFINEIHGTSWYGGVDTVLHVEFSPATQIVTLHQDGSLVGTFDLGGWATALGVPLPATWGTRVGLGATIDSDISSIPAGERWDDFTAAATPAVHTLRRRQQAAPVGSAPRRRQIANRAGSLRRGPGAAP